MSIRRMAALVGLLLLATFANSASRNNNIRIKILDSETRSVSLDNNGVPNNCEQLTFDAYCRSSNAPRITNTLLVQEGNAAPLRVACAVDSKISRCTPLPIGQSFDARREKHGVTIYYVDDQGRARKQFYALVAGDAKAGLVAPAVATAAPPAPSPRPPTQMQLHNASASTPAPPAAAQSALPEKSLPGWVRIIKCNFSSTPSGADITIDGQYVGSTPSEIGLGTGTHVVEMSMPGFAQWKRELAVSPGSEPTVGAVLQKAQ